MTRAAGRGVLVWIPWAMFLCAGLPGPAQAGFQGEVLAGSAGNVIPVRIENISKEEPIKKVVIKLTANSPELNQITVSPQTLNIPPGGAGTFKVSFAVDKSAKSDTVAFMKFKLDAIRGGFQTPAPLLTVRIITIAEETPLASVKCRVGEKELALVAVEWSPPISLREGVTVRHSGDEPGYSYSSKGETHEGPHSFQWSGGFTQFPKRIHLGSPFNIGGVAWYSQKGRSAFCTRKSVNSMFTTPVPPANVYVSFPRQSGHFTGKLPAELPCKGGDDQKGAWTKSAGLKFGIKAIPVKETGSEFQKQFHYKRVASIGSGGEGWDKDGTFVIKWKNAGTANNPKVSSDLIVALRRPGQIGEGMIRLVYEAPADENACLDNVLAYRLPDGMGVTGSASENMETAAVAGLSQNADSSLPKPLSALEAEQRKAEDRMRQAEGMNGSASENRDTSSVAGLSQSSGSSAPKPLSALEAEQRKAEDRMRQAEERRRKELEDLGLVPKREKSKPAGATTRPPATAKKPAPRVSVRIRPDSSIEIVMSDPVGEKPSSSPPNLPRSTKTYPMSGEFTSNMKNMTFYESGPYAAEYNEKQNGRIFGTYSGTVFSGYWAAKTSGKRCGVAKDGRFNWGRVRFEFDARFNAFRGKWAHCGDAPKWTWDGKRIGGPAPLRRGQPARGAKTYPMSGVYQTDEGKMTFFKSGPLAAEYNQDNGRIVGDYLGTTFSGYWVEKSSSEKCAAKKDGSFYWGRIHFAFEVGFREFKGKWSYCDKKLGGKWNGTRIGGLR